MAAILDLEVTIVPKPYIRLSSVFRMPEIVEKDISFSRLGHMVPSYYMLCFSSWRCRPSWI